MPQAIVENTTQISTASDGYCGWPTLFRRTNGELLAVCSGRREHHVCPYGKVLLFRSTDEGATWLASTVVVDGPLDDRDAGIQETSDGTLVISWFTSLAWEYYLNNKVAVPYLTKKIGAAPSLSPAELEAWEAKQETLTDEIRAAELGCWVTLSHDGGKTWSPKIDSLLGSPHGPIRLADGRLFYAGRFHSNGKPSLKGSPFQPKIGAAQSCDGGKTWQAISEIPPMPEQEADTYHDELNAVEAADGRIVVQIRNPGKLHRNEVLQTESFDGGKTWTPVHSTGVWGFPTHLLKLSDGRLLMSVGHRREPMGCQVCLSTDHGANWSTPMIIGFSDQGNSDLGYPSTVEIAHNRFLTLWYDRTKDPKNGALRLARWSLKDD